MATHFFRYFAVIQLLTSSDYLLFKRNNVLVGKKSPVIKKDKILYVNSNYLLKMKIAFQS